MDFAPSAFWNSRSITHLANYPSPSLPMISSDESSYAKLGWFNWETKKYDPACVLDEQVELFSLIGDIALRNGEPQVHAHVVVGRSDGTAHGGHLLEARVRPTCELILT